jgi:DNA-binding protein HU-beta
MNKRDLIEAVASCSGLTKAKAQRAIDCYHECVKGALKSGDRVALVGFGSFSVTGRNARTGRNPQTGRELIIPAKKVIKFKPGSDLFDAVQ